MSLLLKNANIFNGKDNVITSGNILLAGDKIVTISSQDIPVGSNVKVLDLEGKYVMPGLIDAHVHITASQIDFNEDQVHKGYMYARTFNFLRDMIRRGFTSIRDAGGADIGIQKSIEDGLLPAPRLFMSCRALSQTGGHGDFRHQAAEMATCACSLCSGSSISIICDGVTAVRHAVREQFRVGASQIKIMAGGGIASPTDKIENLQYSDEEIIAIVDEARRFNSYVMAHAYTPAAISRCVKYGVKTIEHGNLLDEQSAKDMHDHQAYLVPTLAIYNAFKNNMSPEVPDSVVNKLDEVRLKALESIRLARLYNVKVGLGTDLLGDFHSFEYDELTLRSQVESAFDTLHSATYINAEILDMKDKLGVVAENAFADLLVLPKNPLDDIYLFNEQEDNVLMVIKNGEIVKDLLV